MVFQLKSCCCYSVYFKHQTGLSPPPTQPIDLASRPVPRGMLFWNFSAEYGLSPNPSLNLQAGLRRVGRGYSDENKLRPRQWKSNFTVKFFWWNLKRLFIIIHSIRDFNFSNLQALKRLFSQLIKAGNDKDDKLFWWGWENWSLVSSLVLYM